MMYVYIGFLVLAVLDAIFIIGEHLTKGNNKANKFFLIGLVAATALIIACVIILSRQTEMALGGGLTMDKSFLTLIPCTLTAMMLTTSALDRIKEAKKNGTKVRKYDYVLLCVSIPLFLLGIAGLIEKIF